MFYLFAPTSTFSIVSQKLISLPTRNNPQIKAELKARLMSTLTLIGSIRLGEGFLQVFFLSSTIFTSKLSHAVYVYEYLFQPKK